jgi:signal recognition particle subunit SRP54
VARDFIERVKARSIGEEAIQSIQPGQQVIKIIHDEWVTPRLIIIPQLYP